MHISLPTSRSYRTLLLAILVVFVVGTGYGVALLRRPHVSPAKTSESSEDEASEELEGRKHEAIIWIKADGYLPSTLRIPRDTVVFWENHDTVTHRIVFTPGSPKPEHFDETDKLLPGKQFGIRFMQDGTFHYHNPLNPKFEGTIVISK